MNELVSTVELASRFGISRHAVFRAFKDGRLEGEYQKSRIFVQSISDGDFRRIFPLAASERELYRRWMQDHDICAMGVRAVRETA
ncbi:MAG: hypothetical protein ACR2RF_26185 [Geminicoccaceae bacterium]